MEVPKRMLLICLLLFSDIFVFKISSEGVTPEEAKQLRDEVIICLRRSPDHLLRISLETQFNFLRFLFIYIFNESSFGFRTKEN